MLTIQKTKMKRQLLIYILLLFTSVTLAQKRNYNIGLLLDHRPENVEPLLKTMQDQIIAVVGEDAIINFPENSILVNDFSLQKAEQNYNTLLANTTDIILAFGVVNNEIVSKQSSYRKPTILFGAINRDFSNIDFSKSTSNIHNFTYLIESESFTEDIKKFKELTNFKNLGIIVENHVLDILPLEQTFEEKFRSLDTDYKVIPFKTVSDIISNLDGVDAVYLASGFFFKR